MDQFASNLYTRCIGITNYIARTKIFRSQTVFSIIHFLAQDYSEDFYNYVRGM